jgi:hypothetical protein
MKKYAVFFLFVFFVSLSLHPQNNNAFYLNSINDEFIGVYLPVEYIDSLKATKNHSLSMHSQSKPSNDRSRYHDVLAVEKNIIYSNLRWHDQYAITAAEGNLFQYLKDGEDAIIKDNNGYLYKKIGNAPTKYYSIVRTFVGKIVFEKLLEKEIGVSIVDGTITIPFLYFFTGQDTYMINLDDLFFEKGINIILYNLNDYSSHVGMIIDGEENMFYNLSRIGDIYKKSNLVFNLNNNEDKVLISALSGITESPESGYVQFLNDLTEYDRRRLINTMFALNGYSFATEQWKTFFSGYSWYKPNIAIRNDPGILNIRQRRLLDYLNR